MVRAYILPFLLLLPLMTYGCGSGSIGAVTGGGPTDLEESLVRLGVDVEQSPRLDDFGNPLPESYSPLGHKFVGSEVLNDDGTTSVALGARVELFLMGLRFRNCLEDECFVSLIDDAGNTVDFTNNPDIIYRRTQPAPWAVESLDDDDPVTGDFIPPETLRAGIGADLDGDGRSEIAIVYFDRSTAELRLSVADTDVPGSIPSDIPIFLSSDHFPIADVRIAAGNFDGDSEEELAIGISRGATSSGPGSAAFVLLLDDQHRDFAFIEELVIPAMDGNRSVSLVLESGQIDFDGPMEILVVQNEIGSAVNLPSGTVRDAASRFHILDSDDSSFTVVRSGSIEAVSGQDSIQAVVGDVALGDLDSDNLDEIILAGLTAFPENGTCNFDDNSPVVGHVLVALDDSIHGLERLSNSSNNPTADADGRCPDFDPWRLRFAHVNVLDVDGDDDLEIQVNQFTFDELPQGIGISWTVEAKFDAAAMTEILFRDQEGGALFDRSTHSMTVGDITGDGRDNLITYLSGDGEIDIWGVEPGENPVGVKPSLRNLQSTLIVPPPPGTVRTNPVIVSADTDRDGHVYIYTGEHEHAFTQPIVLAALAAPPCQVGIGQNLGDCTTTWGQSTTLGIGREKGYELTAGVSFGFGGDVVVCAGAGVSVCSTATEWSIKASVEAALSRARSESYELTKSFAFTSGPLEDSVVFTSVPLDIYTYILRSHPDPSRIGQPAAISLPREIVTRIVERTFYNANVKEGSLKVDDDVFSHIPGEISTYPSGPQGILDARRSQLENVRVERFILANPLFDDGAPLDALRGLEVGPIGVGQGGGSTEIGLDLFREESLEVTHEIRLSLEVEVSTGPKIGGFNIGGAKNHALTVSKGENTTYSGSIGSIDGEHFVDNQYQFGLFTYLQADPLSGMEFEVINYWVE